MHYLTKLRVKCLECGEEHGPQEFISLNLEENAMGEDVVTFICPVTDQITKTRVYSVS